MNTTLMPDSIVGDEWLRQTAAQVPIGPVIDKATGQPTGDIITGPVRIAYHDLFVLPQKKADQTSDPKYGARILFTPLADFKYMNDKYYELCAIQFPNHYSNGQYHGLRSPFRDQAEKAGRAGHKPGCVFMTCTSKFKPPVVDSRMNPIVDPSRVYAGVWAICALKPYTYNDPKNRGVGFGLQSVMIIGDDTKLSGNGPDTKAHFGGFNVAAPVVRPDVANNMPTGTVAAPAGHIPGYTPPPAGAPAPAAAVDEANDPAFQF